MKRMAIIAAVAALAVFAAGAAAHSVAAQPASGTAGPVGWLGANGSYAVIAGPIVCGEDDVFQINAWLTQDNYGAMAAGSVRGRCSGDTRAWALTAMVPSGTALLGPGLALFCAGTTTASVLDDGAEDNPGRNWCMSITLQEPLPVLTMPTETPSEG